VKPDAQGVVVIPSSWTVIPFMKFYQCKDLKSVEIPRSVTEIAAYAFSESGLEVLFFEVNSHMETISGGAFEDTHMTSVEIPKSVTEIAAYAFYQSGLEVLLFEAESRLETIGSYAFANTHIQSVEIQQSVQRIGRRAYSFSSLLELIFEAKSRLETIGALAFDHTNLQTINIPTNVTIGSDAFKRTSCDDASIFVAGKDICNCVRCASVKS